jgi:hypothetical protein
MVLVGGGRRQKGPAFRDGSTGSRARERGKSTTGTGQERTRAGAEPSGSMHGRAERAGAPEADATSVYGSTRAAAGRCRNAGASVCEGALGGAEGQRGPCSRRAERTDSTADGQDENRLDQQVPA